MLPKDNVEAPPEMIHSMTFLHRLSAVPSRRAQATDTTSGLDWPVICVSRARKTRKQIAPIFVFDTLPVNTIYVDVRLPVDQLMLLLDRVRTAFS